MADRQELSIRWLPPPEGKLKLNVDGVSKEWSNQADAIMCHQRQRGSLDAWVGKEFGLLFSLACWVMGCAHELAWGKRFKNIILETDSLSVIELLSDGDYINNPYHVFISKCKFRLQREWAVKISHEYKEANNVVYGIANWVLPQTLGQHLLIFLPMSREFLILDG